MSEAPGHEWWVLGASSTCDCGWVGLATSPEEAALMWATHSRRAGHDPGSTNHVERTS